MRCDYLMATLNPDDPGLDVYKEYINCSRPLPEWEDSTPREIKDELKEEPKPGWVHWFFSLTIMPDSGRKETEDHTEYSKRNQNLEEQDRGTERESKLVWCSRTSAERSMLYLRNG